MIRKLLSFKQFILGGIAVPPGVSVPDCDAYYSVSIICYIILLLSCNIETNPGPIVEHIEKELSEIATDIKEI